MSSPDPAMPTYEYFCEKCQKSFDAFQSMKDDPYSVCPEGLCLQEQWGKGEVKRQLGTGAGLLFKGSGFYITDYRSENYKSAAKKESGSGSADSGGQKKESGSGSASSSSSGGKSESGSSSSASQASKPGNNPGSKSAGTNS